MEKSHFIFSTGAESMHYRFVADSTLRDSVISFLSNERNAQITVSKDGFQYLLIQGSDRCIEFQIVPESYSDYLIVNVRSALCNPDDSFSAIFQIFCELLSKFSGRVIDLSSNQGFTSINNSEREDLYLSLQKKKSNFQKWYGNFTSAIQSADVYKTIFRDKLH